MEIFEELNDMYQELRTAGVVRTKKELAANLEVNEKGLIMAMKGDPRYATPSLRTKMLRFRDEHLGGKQPAPEEGKREAMDRLLDNMYDAHQLARKAMEQTDRLIDLLEMEVKARAGMAAQIPEGKNGASLTD